MRVETGDKAQIESIKLQQAAEKDKKDRRKERKDKKERKERKGEEKKNDKATKKGEKSESKKDSHKRKNDERSQKAHKLGDEKKKENETEQFERSGLTEEFGHPVSSINHCESPDSSLNSNKRQKCNSISDGKHNSGSIIRIRLPLQRHKDPEVLLPSKEQPQPGIALTSTDALVKDECKVAPRLGSEHLCSVSRTSDQGHSIKLSNKVKPRHPTDKAEVTPASSGLSPIELQFRNLIENWVPPPMQAHYTEFDDQKWLFESKKKDCTAKVASTKVACSKGLSCGNSISWPRACFLPEAEIYALPYTIPF